MSDTTFATLSVPTYAAALVKKLIMDELSSIDTIHDFDGVTTFEDDCINYGDWRIEDELQQRKIPYDRSWDAGAGYPAGHEWFRPDGERVREVYDYVTPPAEDWIRIWNKHGGNASCYADSILCKLFLSWWEERQPLNPPLTELTEITDANLS